MLLTQQAAHVQGPAVLLFTGPGSSSCTVQSQALLSTFTGVHKNCRSMICKRSDWWATRITSSGADQNHRLDEFVRQVLGAGRHMHARSMWYLLDFDTQRWFTQRWFTVGQASSAKARLACAALHAYTAALAGQGGWHAFLLALA
jgi:hypothetical protein